MKSYTQTISSKGQLTIPRWIAKRLSITQGTVIEIELRGEDAFAAAVRKRAARRTKS